MDKFERMQWEYDNLIPEDFCAFDDDVEFINEKRNEECETE